MLSHVCSPSMMLPLDAGIAPPPEVTTSPNGFASFSFLIGGVWTARVGENDEFEAKEAVEWGLDERFMQSRREDRNHGTRDRTGV